MDEHRGAPEISGEFRRELDAMRVAAIAEYLCGRLELAAGEKTLQISFKDGRYDRMKRFAAA